MNPRTRAANSNAITYPCRVKALPGGGSIGGKTSQGKIGSITREGAADDRRVPERI
jgi:hypothetical protein